MVSVLTTYYCSSVKDDFYLIAHNNFGYDQLVLESEFLRCNIKMPYTWSFIDSLPYIKECFPVFGKTNGTKLSYKLDVNGNINCTGLNVNGTPFTGGQFTKTGNDILPPLLPLAPCIVLPFPLCLLHYPHPRKKPR